MVHLCSLYLLTCCIFGDCIYQNPSHCSYRKCSRERESHTQLVNIPPGPLTSCLLLAFSCVFSSQWSHQLKRFHKGNIYTVCLEARKSVMKSMQQNLIAVWCAQMFGFVNSCCCFFNNKITIIGLPTERIFSAINAELCHFFWYLN